ncbi:hypothetical protein [Methylobacterium aerolatum]|uniref:Invasion associated locus B family protein n=1 Tax=Methylobacterium aerolatum TaxID=418708 RepID=A0ABU0HWV4_9HYPH|nr:hypothetical protein [Methylobacterium aerolatum]MDQ0445964.1 hypothetical protein [Methylobacterium aerolatum]
MAIPAFAQNPIATPAIDESLFKEGSIQLREFNSKAWYAKCQEIIKIKKRVCNLLSTLPGTDGRPDGSILIATTDAGVPAVMIVLAKDVAEGRPISVKSSNIAQIDGRAVKVEYNTVATSQQCDATCKYMFPLDSRLVFTLNAGEPASIFVPAEEPAPPPDPKAKSRKQKHKAEKNEKVEKAAAPLYTILGDGFADALKASTQGW